MSIRAVILGLLLGLGVSAATYFNDKVINQTMLIGNHFPISVFGAAVILLLIVNPLLRLLGERMPLRGGEVAIIAAIALAACGWPGSGYFRGFDTIVGLPAHWAKTKPSWQSQELFSYVPGASANVAPGHVQDWPEVIRWLSGGAAAGGEATDAGAAEAWGRLSEPSRVMVTRAAEALSANRRLESSEEGRLLRVINAELIEPVGERALHRAAIGDAAAAPLAEAQELRGRAGAIDAALPALLAEREARAAEHQKALEAKAGDTTATQAAMAAAGHRVWRMEQEAGFLRREADHAERHANRAALAAMAPGGAVLPAPEGDGVLAASGRADEFVVDTLLSGRSNDPMSPSDLPWSAWWPSVRLWWSLALLLGLASLCVTLIVHPQWSRRELLPYPIARFVEEATETKAGRSLPEVARSPMFWGAFVSLVALHSVNGLHAWFPQVPEVSLTLDLSGLQTLFPIGARVPSTYGVWGPTIFLSVIAFAFFLTTTVSFSVGISNYLFMILGSLMLVQGMAVEANFEGGNPLNVMRFGAYLGMFLIILYTGRRYYARVAGGMIGLSRGVETPGYAIAAAWGLALASVASVFVLKTAGLTWGASAVFVALALLIMIVMTRIVVETGVFFMQPTWMPAGVLIGLFGFDYIGPTTFIVLSIASFLVVGDPREIIMPYLANAMQMADRSANVRPSRIAPWLGAMVIAGFVVAGVATMYFQYRYGLSAVDGWTKESLPTMSFGKLNELAANAAATGSLAEAASGRGAFAPGEGAFWWTGLGLGLVLATAAARLRLPWWPLHPIAFLVWGTYPINQFAFSFLLGWAVKAAVVKTMGAKGYHSVKPLMIGIIAGELFAGLLWMAVGATYFYVQGINPVSYSIFPG